MNARNWLQNALAGQGNLQESITILERMHEIDPLYRPGFGNLILRYCFIGKMNEARQVLERVRPFFRTTRVSKTPRL